MKVHMISLEGSNCLIFATVQLTLLLKLATNAYLEIKSKSFGWNWFSSYQLIVYIEREMTTLLCNECGKSFTDEPLLYIHQTRQHDKTSYSCGECGTEVIGKMALNNHKRESIWKRNTYWKIIMTQISQRLLFLETGPNIFFVMAGLGVVAEE